MILAIPVYSILFTAAALITVFLYSTESGKYTIFILDSHKGLRISVRMGAEGAFEPVNFW